MDSKTLFAKTPPVKLFFIAAMPGAVSMLASALYGLLDGLFVGQFVGSTAFAALWPLGLTGIWLNFAGTALLAAVLSLVILVKMRPQLSRPDSPAPEPQEP